MEIVDDPVFAVEGFRYSDEPQTILLVAHHLVMDVICWRVIWHELG